MTPRAENFYPWEQKTVDAIRDRLGIARFDVYGSIPSTNDLALEMLRSGNCPLPSLVVAEEQTKGRGRGVNRWSSPAGCLMFSLILPFSANPSASMVPLAAGLAIRKGLDFLCGDAGKVGKVQVKWPNDVYLNGQKVAGILVEAAEESRGVVIGAGININNSFREADPDLRRKAISTFDFTQESLHLPTVLELIVREMIGRVNQISAGHDDLLRELRENCFLTGRSVVIDATSQRVSGIVAGIDDSGRLIVRQGLTQVPIVAGSVEVVE